MRWIVGDIHGMIRPLEALVREVRSRDPEARFLFVGDYVNRGPDSRRVVEFLMSLDRAQLVRGNHDDVFDHILNHMRFEVHAESYLTFLNYGLDSTLTSYGVDLLDIVEVSRRPTDKNLRDLLEPVPARHRNFFRALPAAIEEPDLFVVHAKWDVDAGDDSDDLQNALATDRLVRQTLQHDQVSHHVPGRRHEASGDQE